MDRNLGDISPCLPLCHVLSPSPILQFCAVIGVTQHFHCCCGVRDTHGEFHVFEWYWAAEDVWKDLLRASEQLYVCYMYVVGNNQTVIA